MKNGLTKLLLFFFLKTPKIWVGWTTLKGKKEDGLYRNWSICMSLGLKGTLYNYKL